MKRFKVGRILGIGMGVGLASVAVYQSATTNGTDNIPESFDANFSEFRSLADLESGPRPFLQSINDKATVLVQFDSNDDDDNQIVLPVTDEMTSTELQLAPMLTEQASDQAVAAEPVMQDLATDQADDPDSAIMDLSQVASTPMPATPAEDGKTKRLFEVHGSTWKANPFLDQTALDQSKQVQEITEAKVADENLTPNKPLDQVFQFAAADVQPSQPATVLPDSMNNSGAISADPYSIAPMKMAVTESVAQRAAQHIEYGKSLSRRGAAYAARQEFYAALTTLAQANDAQVGTNEFSHALRQGILAMKEAEDFVVRDAESQIGLNVGMVIETHQTGVLTKVEAERMTPIQAMQRYFAAAQQQLNYAGGSNVVAGEALFCLGKLHTSVSEADPTSSRLDLAKAMVYHQAALESDSNNYRSANELGVLMARSGRLEAAKELLKTSLRINPAPHS